MAEAKVVRLTPLAVFLIAFFVFSYGQERECTEPSHDIYMGYYTENPLKNPEDPTAGILLSCLPARSGPFTTEFLFSYVGCMGGVNVGRVRGSKDEDSMGGLWSGTVDGQNIGGNFRGVCMGSYCSGKWTNSKGKQFVGFGTCRYYVSPEGNWHLFTIGEGYGGLDPHVDTSTSPPRIRWNRVSGAGYYFVYVYSRECLYRTVSLSQCTLWHAVCGGEVSSVSYGDKLTCREIVPAGPLKSGRYVVSVIATGRAVLGMLPAADVKAFRSGEFTVR